MKQDQLHVFIEESFDLERVAADLKKEPAIGVDLEADSMYHYHEKVCLIQISSSFQNILIDPLALDDLSPLAAVFSDFNIRKIFHGADYDIRSLHRDFNIEVNSLFDTQIAATFLGLRETGLAGLLNARFNVRVEKKYQKKDWSKRPLTEPMLKYAVQDSAYLLSLAHILEGELKAKGILFCVEEECERLSKVRMNQSENDHLFLKFKGAGKLGPRRLTLLETVLRFRDELARKMDLPPYKVLGNVQIIKIIKEKPKNFKELKSKECLSPKQFHRFGQALSKNIENALSLPDEALYLYPKKSGHRLGPKAQKHVKALKEWRDQRADEMGLNPALICSNTQIQSLAKEHPKTQKDLKELSMIRDWQRELFGHEICSILE